MTASTPSLLDDVIAGIWCVELAQLDDITIPMRAIAETERTDLVRLASLSPSLALGTAAPAVLVEDAAWPMLISRTALEPAALSRGILAPLWSSAEAGALAPADIDALATAQRKAQLRASPDLDEDGVTELIEALRDRAKRSYSLSVRARHSQIADFFGVPSVRHVTDWQATFFVELTHE